MSFERLREREILGPERFVLKRLGRHHTNGGVSLPFVPKGTELIAPAESDKKPPFPGIVKRVLHFDVGLEASTSFQALANEIGSEGSGDALAFGR